MTGEEDLRLPSVSIVIPTLNSEAVLEGCLESIFSQDYPETLLEIIVADGGSTDWTQKILAKFAQREIIPIHILDNPLRTGEAGKAAGVRSASGEIIALIDSDNILPDPGWLMKMVVPFEDQEVIASEPLEYTYRRSDGFITRYCALLGMNDPFCLFKGNYDRLCHLTGRWTEMPVQVEDRQTYLKITPDPERMPTFGANGFLIKKDILVHNMTGEYLFDIDVLVELGRQGPFAMAKVKTGIVHIFSGNLSTFLKKQKRRIRDYLCFHRRGMRAYPWKVHSSGTFKFILYSLLVIPLICQAVAGYGRRRDLAWGFHPLACWLTLYTYVSNTILYSWQDSITTRFKHKIHMNS